MDEQLCGECMRDDELQMMIYVRWMKGLSQKRLKHLHEQIGLYGTNYTCDREECTEDLDEWLYWYIYRGRDKL